jgi:hypothetical protein
LSLLLLLQGVKGATFDAISPHKNKILATLSCAPFFSFPEVYHLTSSLENDSN